VQNTDASGLFTNTLAGVPAGLYDWRVNGSAHLATCGTISVGAQSASFEAGVQKAGDINNDNAVGIVDHSAVRTSFGRMCGDPLYDPRADINGDCVINSIDFSLFRRNFGLAGCALP
jgi:hypothetical protein